MKQCSIDSCTRLKRSRGLCQPHYVEQKASGIFIARIPHNKTHGLSNTPEFYVWQSMQARCYRRSDRGYKNYGGRGIRVCDRWLGIDGFRNFLEDVGNRPSPEYSIDRINNDRDYEPDNCRWTTRWVQAVNRRGRQNGRSKYKGVTLHKPTGKWRARVGYKNNSRSLGLYYTQEDAARAYNQAALEYFGDDAWLNPLV